MNGEEEIDCPKCGSECSRESVHNGLAMLYGPFGCGKCGWSEYGEYDRSEGECPAQAEYPNGYVDQWGCYTPGREAIAKAKGETP